MIQVDLCTHVSPAPFSVLLLYRYVLTFHPLLSQCVYDTCMHSLFTRSFLSAFIIQVYTHLSSAPFSVRLIYRYVLTVHPLLSEWVYDTGRSMYSHFTHFFLNGFMIQVDLCTHVSPAPFSVLLLYMYVLTFHRSFLSEFMIHLCTQLSPAPFSVRLWYMYVLTFHPLLSQWVYDTGMYSHFTRSFLNGFVIQVCTRDVFIYYQALLQLEVSVTLSRSHCTRHLHTKIMLSWNIGKLLKINNLVTFR